MAHRFTPSELGIKIRYSVDGGRCFWYGTRQQFEAEGFIPPDAEWPDGRKPLCVRRSDSFLYIVRAGRVDTDASADPVFRMSHSPNSPSSLDVRIRRKLQQARDLMQIGSPTWQAAWERAHAARMDERFQQFKRNLLGQKKRGRKPQMKAPNA